MSIEEREAVGCGNE